MIKKFNILHFAFCIALLLSLLAVFTVGVNAEEPATPAVEFVGQQVNLGGDISMKFYVRNNENRPLESISIEVEFLGKLTYLTECEEHPTDAGVYIYTFEGINPQCLGDPMNVVILIGGSPVGHENAKLTGYSVEKNLNEIYDKCTEAQKQLIDDLRAYGKASEIYTGHTSMTGTNYPVREVEIPATSITATDTAEDVNVHTVNVRFGTMNYLMFKFEFASGTATDLGDKVKIDGEAPADAYIDGNYYVVISKPISPENFHKDVSLVYDESKLTLSYSINDYCRTVADGNYTEEMKTLAKALYNYGLSAHTYVDVHTGGEATCMHGKLCDVCGFEYGEKDTTNHASDTYTYTDNGDGTHTKTHECGVTVGEPEDHTLTYTANGNTITVSCSANCGYSETATISATGKTYDGNAVEVVVSKTGSLEITDIPVTLTKDGEAFTGEPVNVGAYTASVTLGDKTVSVDFTIAKAEASIATAPTPNTLTYTGEAHYLINAGEAVGGTMVYSLTENGEYTTSIPQGTNAGDYTVWYYVQGDANHNDSAKDSVSVNIAKAPLTVTADAKDNIYGYEDPSLTYTAEGLLGGDTLTSALTGALTREEGENVGSYAITLGTLSADNYAISFVGADFTIHAKEVTDPIVTLDQTSYQYDGNVKEPKVTSIVVDGRTLIEGKDYTISYEDNVYVNTEAKVVINFMGNYDGTFRQVFSITQDPNTTEFDGEWITAPKAN